MTPKRTAGCRQTSLCWFLSEARQLSHVAVLNNTTTGEDREEVRKPFPPQGGATFDLPPPTPPLKTLQMANTTAL